MSLAFAGDGAPCRGNTLQTWQAGYDEWGLLQIGLPD